MRRVPNVKAEAVVADVAATLVGAEAADGVVTAAEAADGEGAEAAVTVVAEAGAIVNSRP
ncbi:MAG: hypothetical protein WA192_08310 [Candidatus Acidiferrales bacterium]